ncbi:restriction endonuclease subunit S [Pseudoramibacter faecis]|uniref:restriction endonuclease subunit S n=1 Tax=Pseudoramibacter faecis TaxID=3108534 RepID=UPI002E766C6B|nr:restriction endonuclease subunit S [Pseudoramibacter sp. HA2172]
MAGYTDMVETGVSWIPKLPEHWKLRKIDALFTERKTKVSDTDYAPLSVTKKGILPQLEHAAKSNDGDNRKLVKAGDFVINSRSDRKGSCGVSSLDGSVSLINLVLTPRSELNSEFIHYLLRNYRFSEEYYRNGRGIVADLWTTRYSEMRTIQLPVPPRAEQDQIVRFLDWKVSEINKLIGIRRREIRELEELKKSTINRAVTTGVHSETTLKDSGIKWIGKILNSWEVLKFKTIADSISKGSGITKDDVIADGNIQCIRYGEIYSKYDYGFEETSTRTNLERVKSPKFISYGDILFAGTGELVDEIGKNIVYLGKDKCLAGGDIIVASHSQDAKFLNYALNSTYAQNQKSFGKFKLKVVHIKPGEIGDILVALPPLAEQREIAAYLDSFCAGIDNAIQLSEEKIETLKELKSVTISDVVTGKVDVRNIPIPEYDHVNETADDADCEEDEESDTEDFDGEEDA